MHPAVARPELAGFKNTRSIIDWNEIGGPSERSSVKTTVYNIGMRGADKRLAKQRWPQKPNTYYGLKS
jgi:hypothetical protein